MSSEKTKIKSEDKIEVIYHQRNDSPKFFVLEKNKLMAFIIGLPAIAILSLLLGIVGIINISPFHLIDNYRQNSKAREYIANTEEIINKSKILAEENIKLKNELALLKEKNKKSDEDIIPDESVVAGYSLPASPNVQNTAPVNNDKKIETVDSQIPSVSASIGLSTLSLFKPIQGQKDRTRPAQLAISGFKTLINRDTVNFQFNIIPSSEQKIAGHIIVVMKNDIYIQVYPFDALRGGQTQINYSAGESFATQRFRPVDSSFLKPKKSGNYTFSVYIFAKNGDLIHYQSMIMPLRL